MHLYKFALLASACVLLPETAASAQQKKVLTTASDLPSVVIELPAKPSVIALEGGPAFDRIEQQVAAYTDQVMNTYDVRDVSTRQSLLGMKLQTALIENRWDDALKLTDEIKALEQKPAAKATSGMITRAYIHAAQAVGENSPQFGDRFEAELRDSVSKLDWTLTQDQLQSLHAQFQLMSRDLLIGSLQGGLDTNAAAQNNKVGVGFALGILGARRTLTDILPIKDRIVRVLDARMKTETAEKQDLWTKRLATLTNAQVKAPVTVAVWDGGTDPSVFPGLMWTNSKEVLNGRDDDGNGFVDDVNGIAFDTDWKPSTGMLRTMPAEDLQDLSGNLRLTKGMLDLQANVNSPEAAAVRQRIAGLKPDQVQPFMLQESRLGLYLHGTTTAWTSARGNPGVRIMPARFDYKIENVPSPMDEKVADNFADYAAKTVGYFKAHGVRVVNMSWRITEPQIAATLAVAEPDPVKRKARALAVFNRMNGALEAAFRSAPNILFVAGAGNEDEDVDFVRSFPAGINLPNLMTVGAVDVALQPAGFTSYGKSIDVYANGFEVPAKTPGGMDINISGTSLAAPQVTNLAAKLFAANPRLTVAQARQIIEGTSTPEGDKKLMVINPQAALARALK